MQDMDPELSLAQAREIALLRRRHPGAEVRIHPRRWGLIAEARRDGRTVELERFDWAGHIARDQRLSRAA
jgi:hypothetical protein